MLKVGISDPTMKNEGKIRVELDKKVEDVITKDDRITILEINEDKIAIEVDVKDAKGATISAELKLKQENTIKTPINLKIENINKNILGKSK